MSMMWVASGRAFTAVTASAFETGRCKQAAISLRAHRVPASAHSVLVLTAAIYLTFHPKLVGCCVWLSRTQGDDVGCTWIPSGVFRYLVWTPVAIANKRAEGKKSSLGDSVGDWME
ncbi:hypothetical protein BDZ91DRAFT_764908 [Kalaharituber pfeilii]|nr:hypothetical protein BDZ91DRAFT_764908 [Kalaharituber pfeilii]